MGFVLLYEPPLLPLSLTLLTKKFKMDQRPISTTEALVLTKSWVLLSLCMTDVPNDRFGVLCLWVSLEKNPRVISSSSPLPESVTTPSVLIFKERFSSPSPGPLAGSFFRTTYLPTSEQIVTLSPLAVSGRRWCHPVTLLSSHSCRPPRPTCFDVCLLLTSPISVYWFI